MCHHLVWLIGHQKRHAKECVRMELDCTDYQQERVARVRPKSMSPVMDGAMNTAFASALSVPEQPCDYASKLDSMMSTEISTRVNRTLAFASDTEPDTEPVAIYVPGTFSKLEVLYKMVKLCCGALWSYLARVKSTTRCLGACWRPKTSQSVESDDEEPRSVKMSNTPKSAISVKETTEAVSEILRKWTDPEESDPECSQPKTSADLHGTASNIVTTIRSDLHYSTNKKKSNASLCPHFDLRLIQNTLTNFFSSREPTPRQEVIRKSSFVEFSKNQFTKLVTDCTATDLQKESDFLVGAQPSTVSGSTLHQQASNLETPGSPPPLNFEGIVDKVEDLYTKFPMERPKVSQNMESLRDDITIFSRQLSDKIYDFIRASIATGTSDRRSPHRRKKRRAQEPEVMKKIVEDCVGKFLQQVLLWMEMEPSKRKASADEVCGALRDIDTLIANIMSTETESDESDVSPSRCDQQDYPDALLREMSRNFVSMLIMTLVKYFPKKTRKSLQLDDVFVVIRRLSQKVLNVNLSFLAGENMVSCSRFVQVVLKYLFKQFGSQEKLLEALLSDDMSFDEAVLTQLTNTLNSWHDGADEQSKIKRVFSTVGNTLKRPFTCFSPDYL
ncbi:uncharacterized protein LOC130912533 [Corythoichthys intestinalis]|uniref:uncharacterized protein LOC130912533 n=1 Tax=Corythoichthys intestinalis TaxID=161448 RepID=UPI0025A5277F|nr:uncharacterized protein LOC130912533 [Corythoichthys intestinalis]